MRVMPGPLRGRDSRSRRELVWIAVALIAGTALAALVVMLIAAKAESRSPARAQSRSRQAVPCGRDDREPTTRMRPGAPARPLVPDGALMLTICDYNGMNVTGGTPQFGLLGTYRTQRASTIRRLTAELDAIRPTPPGATYSCPADDASQAILSFYYGSAAVGVDVGTRGCNEITSGHIHRLALGAPVIAQIEKLVRPVRLRWAVVSGHVRLCGGPAPGRCWTNGASVGSVVATNSSNQWVALTQPHRGRFRLLIARPGHYTFRAMGRGSRINSTLAETTATVRAGRTTKLVLTIPVR